MQQYHIHHPNLLAISSRWHNPLKLLWAALYYGPINIVMFLHSASQMEPDITLFGVIEGCRTFIKMRTALLPQAAMKLVQSQGKSARL